MPIVVKPWVRLETDGRSGKRILRALERYGRLCYMSESKINADSAATFVALLIKRGHYSVIEHETVTARIVCDRGVSHEIVRHRIGSYSQESTRYCDYATPRGVTVIDPLFFAEHGEQRRIWLDAMQAAEAAYGQLRRLGVAPQAARLVLPHSVKTELIVTFNLREWRHFFCLRCGAGAHPQIREIALMLLKAMQKHIPIVFDDFVIDERSKVARTDRSPPS